MYKSITKKTTKKDALNSYGLFSIKEKIEPVSYKKEVIEPVSDKNKFYENEPDESPETFMIFRMEK